MKKLTFKITILSSFVYVFFFVYPNHSSVSAQVHCGCLGRYCFAGCTFCSPYPENQYSYIDINGGSVGTCNASDTCDYGNLAGMAGCDTPGWSLQIPCGNCTGGFFDEYAYYNVDTYTCLNYNVCSGGGGGGGGGGCSPGPEIPLKTCQDATSGYDHGLFARYYSVSGPSKLVAQGVYPWPTQGNMGYLHGYEYQLPGLGWQYPGDVYFLTGACMKWTNIIITGYIEIDAGSTNLYQVRTDYKNIWLQYKIKDSSGTWRMMADTSAEWGNKEFSGQKNASITFLNPGWYEVQLEIVTNDFVPFLRIVMDGSSAGSTWYNGFQHVMFEHTIPCNTPPSCSVSSGLSGDCVAGELFPFSATGNDSDSNLKELAIISSPTSARSWTTHSDDTFSDRTSYTKNITLSFPAGSYYVGCNAVDSASPPGACSFNPWCREWSPDVLPDFLCPGWVDCGANDYVIINCVTPTPTPIDTPTNTPTPTCAPPGSPTGLLPSGTLACVSGDTSTVNFSWNSVLDLKCPVSKYAIRIDQDYDSWSDDCTHLDTGDYCEDNVFSNSYSKAINSNHNYKFWVHAINSGGWGQPTYQTFTLPKCTPTPTSAPTNTPTFTPTPTPTCSPISDVGGLTPNGSLSCGTTSTTLRWNPVAGAEYYKLRFQDTANSWGDCSGSNDLCADVYGNSFTVLNLENDHSYKWWVHAISACDGSWTDPTYGNFNIPCNCNCEITPAPPSLSLSVGESETLRCTPVAIGAGCSMDPGMDFDSAASSVASVDPSTDLTSPYETSVTGESEGSTAINCTATVNWVGGTGATCSKSVPVGVIKPASCTISPNPLNTINISSGGTTTTEAYVEVFDGTPSGIISTWQISDLLLATLTPEGCTYSVTSKTYTCYLGIEGNQPGSGTYQISASVTVGANTIICTQDPTIGLINIEPVPPWFQVGPGYTTSSGHNVVVRSGTVSSDIPSSAYNFLKDPLALLIYNSFTDPYFRSGTLSTSGTIVNASTNTNPSLSFNFLYNKLPDDVKSGMRIINSNSIAISDLSSCTLLRGYGICYYDGSVGSKGDLTLTGNYTIPNGTRIILFVDNADVTISGKIISQTRGRSSFLLISEDDINIDPTVGGPMESPPTTVDLEGVFFTDGSFNTGHAASGDDIALHIRGSVVADTFNLVRNIGSGVGKNNTYPAEYFEYGTDQVLALPPFLRLRTTSWEEVQP